MVQRARGTSSRSYRIEKSPVNTWGEPQRIVKELGRPGRLIWGLGEYQVGAQDPGIL